MRGGELTARQASSHGGGPPVGDGRGTPSHMEASEQEPREHVSIIGNGLTTPQKSLPFFSKSDCELCSSRRERADTLRIPDPAHPWSGRLFKTHHGLGRYLRIAPFPPAGKFHCARISPVPFALNQAEDRRLCSAGLRRRPLWPKSRELSGRNKKRRSPRTISPQGQRGPQGGSCGRWKWRSFLPCCISVLPLKN